MTAPISRITTPAGDPAWLVTGFREVRALLADDRVGRSHHRPAEAPQFAATSFARPWGSPSTERKGHARMRHVMARAFTAERMRQLLPEVEAIVDTSLAELHSSGPPADFHRHVSSRVPALVIARLLGVPSTDLADFQRWSDDWGNIADATVSNHGKEQLCSYIHTLTGAKGAGFIWEMMSGAADESLTRQEVVAIAATLLFAGNETTVASINKGILLLLMNPTAVDRLRADRVSCSAAVEEILRAANPLPKDPSHSVAGLVRYAQTDIQVAGVLIRAGEMILLQKTTANQDPAVFASPELFDIDRQPQHLAFGHGRRYCPGAPLARLEMQVVFARTFDQFPDLKLAVPARSLRRKMGLLTTRPEAIPVTWSP